ncbi:MAG: alpha-E domain-containing protein [Planctomycetota bacterium]
MLSRVAHSLYWMARYVERAENVARFIEVTLHLNLDRQLDEHDQWQPLLQTSGDLALFAERYGTATRENVIQFLAFDTDYPNSIISSLAAARENARGVREAMSRDMWQQLNSLFLAVRDAASSGGDVVYDFFESVKIGAIGFYGLSSATMSRGEAWQWMRLGTMIERADKTSRILDVKYFLLLPQTADVGSNYDHVQWAALLQSASALQMYRQRHHHTSPERVAEFLLLDQEFPRAVSYCIGCADLSLHAITGSPPGRFAGEAERQLGRLRAGLGYAAIEDIIADGLHEFIDRQQGVLNAIDSLLFDEFFAHSG